jgi:hypothetical protein
MQVSKFDKGGLFLKKIGKRSESPQLLQKSVVDKWQLCKQHQACDFTFTQPPSFLNVKLIYSILCYLIFLKADTIKD